MFGLDVNRWNLEGSEDGGSITQITKLQVYSDNHPKPSSCQGSILPSMCPNTILTYTLINSQNKLLKKKPQCCSAPHHKSVVSIISLHAAAQLVCARAWFRVSSSSIPLRVLHALRLLSRLCHPRLIPAGSPVHMLTADTRLLPVRFLPQPPSLNPASHFCFD